MRSSGNPRWVEHVGRSDDANHPAPTAAALRRRLRGPPAPPATPGQGSGSACMCVSNLGDLRAGGEQFVAFRTPSEHVAANETLRFTGATNTQARPVIHFGDGIRGFNYGRFGVLYNKSDFQQAGGFFESGSWKITESDLGGLRGIGLLRHRQPEARKGPKRIGRGNGFVVGTISWRSTQNAHVRAMRQGLGLSEAEAAEVIAYGIAHRFFAAEGDMLRAARPPASPKRSDSRSVEGSGRAGSDAECARRRAIRRRGRLAARLCAARAVCGRRLRVNPPGHQCAGGASG